MSNSSDSRCSSHGWLDTFAISMSIICAIHCLLTPIIVISLPLLATTFWVHKDFHLWMLLIVLPTTSFAVFLGCRKHRDKFVLGLSLIGLSCIFAVSIYESFFHINQLLHHGNECIQCTRKISKDFLNFTTLTNVMGGGLLASAHVRNYRLCRRVHCTHD